MTSHTSDPELEALESALRRREARLARYLKVRAAVGLVLMVLGVVGFAGAVAVAGVPLGLWHIESVAPWTHGFGAVLAVFLPFAFGFICFRTGWSYWRHRHPERAETGCLAA
ncbi:MAG: hypothetical protein ACQEXJ_05925 [Myxococcota bacterium]